MKKFFSLCVLAATALLGLTSCGGGGDTDPGSMSVADFARCNKKFLVYNKIYLYVVPESREDVSDIHDDMTSTCCTCLLLAGEDEIGRAKTVYTRVSDTSYMMTYSFGDSEFLKEEAVIMAFGFTPVSQNSNGDSFQMPDSIGSLGQVTMETQMDMASHLTRTDGKFNQVDKETNLIMTEPGVIQGSNVPFIVLPQ